MRLVDADEFIPYMREMAGCPTCDIKGSCYSNGCTWADFFYSVEKFADNNRPHPKDVFLDYHRHNSDINAKAIKLHKDRGISLDLCKIGLIMSEGDENEALECIRELVFG